MAGPVTVNSRGDSLSAYLPPVSKGAKLYADGMKAAFLSGTIVSGRIVVAVAHGLAKVPKSVVVCPLLTGAQGASAVALTVSVAAASAATSTNIYLISSAGTNKAIKYAAYVQI